MSVVEKSIEELLEEFSNYAGAEPLIPLFETLSQGRTVKPMVLRHQVEVLEEWRECREDVLVSAAKTEALQATLVLSKHGRGLAMFVFSGNPEEVLEHHSDLITEPPLYNFYEDIKRPGIGRCNPDCNVRLLTIARGVDWSDKMRMNLFPVELSAGSKRLAWYLDILQQVNTQGNRVSSFKREKSSVLNSPNLY